MEKIVTAFNVSIYSAFYEFLNKNIYTFRVNEAREVWYYKNVAILRNVVGHLFPNIPTCETGSFINAVEIRSATPEILSLFEQNKDSILKAVKPVVSATKKAIKYGLNPYYEVNSISKLNVGDSKRTPHWYSFKGYTIRLWETADYDWGYYAKSYNHPKKTVEDREIIFSKKRGEEKRVSIPSFRTSDVIKGIAEFFKIPLASKNKLQTNPYFEVQKIKDTAKYAVYIQTFGGEVVGYVISDGKTTYHDDTKKAAIEGWKKKAALAQEKKEIKAGLRFTAAQLHEDYGFCWAGIHEFADACGLDTTKSYTQKELRTAFNKSPERRTLLIKYKSELSQIL